MRARDAAGATGGDGTLDALVSTSLTVLDVTVRAVAVIVLSLAVVALVGVRRPAVRAAGLPVADVRVDASRTAILPAPRRTTREAARAAGLLGAVALGSGLAAGLGVAIVLARLAGALAGVGAR